MILAPRSCPSSPGLATTTRILRLDSGLSAAVSLVACINREGLAAGRAATGPCRRAGGIVSGVRLFGGLRSLDPGRLERSRGQLRAQDLLVELADARLRDRIYERKLVGQPPLRDLRLEVLANCLRG